MGCLQGEIGAGFVLVSTELDIKGYAVIPIDGQGDISREGAIFLYGDGDGGYKFIIITIKVSGYADNVRRADLVVGEPAGQSLDVGDFARAVEVAAEKYSIFNSKSIKSRGVFSSPTLHDL